MCTITYYSVLCAPLRTIQSYLHHYVLCSLIGTNTYYSVLCAPSSLPILMTSSTMLILMRLRNFYLIELIMLLNYVVLLPYLLKIQLNHGFQVRFVKNIKKRQNYYSLLRENRMSHQFYSRFRNFVTNQIRRTKINYFARKFRQFNWDCKGTWKQINSIIRPNRINKKNIINKIFRKWHYIC